jgi:hypothetical protein
MIRVDGSRFRDEFGRTLILRGVNLGGSSKVPAQPNGATYVPDDFSDHRNVSFVGRPFPLAEADEHFSRLRAWGLTFLRLLVPWEAVEHAGPGIYDQEYLDYLQRIVAKAADHGFRLFIDPHQDVWSRMSGGDGAPGWTLEAVGMDVTRLAETGAAITHQAQGDPFPRMIWPTNYSKLAAATMFSLFFGGNDFAPTKLVDGEPVQEFLQRHYMGALKQVALKLRDLPNVVGYDTLNEPSSGFIGWPDLNGISGLLRLGFTPTPFQAMLLGAGFPQEVEEWDMRLTGAKLLGRKLLNEGRARAWRDGCDCVWRESGVWDLDGQGVPRLLRPDYFLKVEGHTVDFGPDYLRPFVRRYAEEMRSIHPDAIIFVEGVPGQGHAGVRAAEVENVVNAAHWYDGLTLFAKKFTPWLTVEMSTGKLVIAPWNVRKSFTRQLAAIKHDAINPAAGAPTLIGEVGIPYDMYGKKAYRTGDWSMQVRAMDATMRALEENLLGFTIWNYTADNSNSRGDQWNDEDLSIFSRDQQSDPSDIHSGGRALEAVVRPYACAVAGEPLRLHFDPTRRAFEFEFRHDPKVTAPTELFLPDLQYPEGFVVDVTDGSYEFDRSRQMLLYRHAVARDTHRIRVSPGRTQSHTR